MKITTYSNYYDNCNTNSYQRIFSETDTIGNCHEVFAKQGGHTGEVMIIKY